jgi:hypothetical protein
MIQTDDLDKPLAERCDQFTRLVEVKQSFITQNFFINHIYFSFFRKRKKNTN